MAPSYFFLNHSMASSFEILCLAPILLLHLLRRPTLLPGLFNTTQKSMPKIPVKGSYLIPKSICSWIPKPKQPVSEKFLFLNSRSLTFNPRSRISSAFSPLTVTWAAIFSFLLIPKLLMVYLALDGTGFCPVKSSKTLLALINLSPDSPTLILSTSFSMRISLMGFYFSALAPFVVINIQLNNKYCKKTYLPNPFIFPNLLCKICFLWEKI